jgi:signal transduction histidine kinase
MVQEQQLETRPNWRQRCRVVAHDTTRRLHRLLVLNIRSKIVLPYLVLTLALAVVGIYVVMSLVTSSVSERLTNQLLEAGRVVSDKLALRELEHIESARAIAFTVGLAEALQEGGRDRVAALAQPMAVVRDVECLIIVDAQGQEILHMLQQDDGSSKLLEDGPTGQFDHSGLWMVQALFEADDPNALPERGLLFHPLDERYYYLTAIPIGLDDAVVGVVVVGTSLDTLLPYFQQTSLANVIVYLDGGHAIATTIALIDQSTDERVPLEELSITPALYESVLNGDDFTILENIWIRERPYRFAHAALRVANDSLGTYAVVLPSNFIVEKGVTSRNIYAVIFFAATAGVIAIGYLISQRITNPLRSLVRTSQAVAEGHLDQRTGIASADEIGFLAITFDEMTGRLAERTYALEETLRTLEETLSRMRAILSSIGDGVMLEDLEGNFIPLNATAEIMLKEITDNFLFGPLRELSARDSQKTWDPRPDRWLLERRRFEVGNRVISFRSAAAQTDDGKPMGILIVLRDVTAEVEAERFKDSFITHVSHELRTPLTAIKGYGDLLLSGASDVLNEDQLNFLKTIDRQTDSLMRMISALLDFSEMEAWGRLGLRQHPMRLHSLIEKIAREQRPHVEGKGLTFQVEAPTDLAPVNVDTKRLHWAITNLVRNAWQHTPPGGSVTLQLSECDAQVIVDVIDTGEGIAPEGQKQLFDRIYHATSTAGGETRGLGLGLYVTRAIVEAHGGKIRVASEEGVGSKFSVMLPVWQEEAEKERSVAP